MPGAWENCCASTSWSVLYAGLLGVDLLGLPPGPQGLRPAAGPRPGDRQHSTPRRRLAAADAAGAGRDRQDRPGHAGRGRHHHRGRLFLRAAGQRLELRLDVHRARPVRQADHARAPRYGDHEQPPPGMVPADQGRAGPGLRVAAGPGPERGRRIQAHRRGPRAAWGCRSWKSKPTPWSESCRRSRGWWASRPSSAPIRRSSSWTSTAARRPPWAFPSTT